MKDLITAIRKLTLSKEKKEWYDISEELKVMFHSASACSDVMDEWQNPTRKDLLGMYTNNIKFCIKKNTPYLPYLRKVFKGKCEDMGIFIDEERINIANYPIVVCNGECSGDMLYDKNNFPVYYLHLRHYSNINIIAENNSCVFVYTYGEKCKVRCTAKEKSRVVVFKYSEDAKDFHGKQSIYKTTVSL